MVASDICGSNTDIVKILSTNCTIEKIKKKRPGTFSNSMLDKEVSALVSFVGSVLQGQSLDLADGHANSSFVEIKPKFLLKD